MRNSKLLKNFVSTSVLIFALVNLSACGKDNSGDDANIKDIQDKSGAPITSGPVTITNPGNPTALYGVWQANQVDRFANGAVGRLSIIFNKTQVDLFEDCKVPSGKKRVAHVSSPVTYPSNDKVQFPASYSAKVGRCSVQILPATASFVIFNNQLKLTIPNGSHSESITLDLSRIPAPLK